MAKRIQYLHLYEINEEAVVSSTSEHSTSLLTGNKILYIPVKFVNFKQPWKNIFIHSPGLVNTRPEQVKILLTVM